MKITAVYWKDGKAEMVAIEDKGLLEIRIETEQDIFGIKIGDLGLVIETAIHGILVRPACSTKIRVSSL